MKKVIKQITGALIIILSVSIGLGFIGLGLGYTFLELFKFTLLFGSVCMVVFILVMIGIYMISGEETEPDKDK